MPIAALGIVLRQARFVAVMTTLVLPGRMLISQPLTSEQALLFTSQMSYPNQPSITSLTNAQTPQTVPPAAPNQAGSVVPSLSAEELGDLHMARKRYQAAILAYRQMPHPTPIVLNKIGMANQQMFVMDEAKRSYEAALKMDPKNSDILNNIGTVYYSAKQFGDAEHYYRKALKYHPKSALVYKNLGTALLAEGKFKKGWESYQEALAIDPEIFERPGLYRVGEPTPTQQRGAMNYFLAKSYVQAGMMERAVNYLRLAINQGFTDRKKIMADKEFSALRGVYAFDQLIAEQRM